MIGRLLCRLRLHDWASDHFGGNPNAPVRDCRRPDCTAIEFL